MAKPLVLWQSNHHLIMPRDYLEEFSTKSISLGAILYFHELILFCSKNTIFQFQFTSRLKLLVIKSILVTFTKHTLNKNKRIQLLLSPQQECYYTFITLLNTVFRKNYPTLFYTNLFHDFLWVKSFQLLKCKKIKDLLRFSF